ncbi:hypothetical protein PC118_g21444 [Phytophthora cactorum]|uniref:Uncharacterized protein n=1 Tax=Phytophthora cactorum TaxID=29920 RepID=A0A8T1AQB1_9STRA|nr:hypothetical protein PC113_g21580 [Phytophthora cactorum]KAG2876863.1 hypothetical protein PC114_g23970 [Phytophthora cactorum]KAG2884345.1 hypothetical protein PC115_g21364 [Phytophthora cactorum]KAG2893159.1 hypothetical protein PC117_g23851 [Phytophthora cactorum]KAG2962404.1 hypothetical protein PC118_g21444 [Phytophthora cactorum]
MRGVRRLCSSIYGVWINLQVELHGSYSVSRMNFLSEYSNCTSVFRASISNAGRITSKLFVLGKKLPDDLAHDSCNSRAAPPHCASLIGFPLPFTLVVGIPVWFVGLMICFGIFFGAKLRREPVVRQELLNYIVVIACQVVLTFIYPAYLYGFRSVSSTTQTFYVLLLPIVKIATKNWISFFLGTKDDLKPQVVILNIEVFNALYVASSMQNATSISTTMALTFVDFLLAWISIKDVNYFLTDITLLLEKIPSDHPLKRANFMEVLVASPQEFEVLIRSPHQVGNLQALSNTLQHKGTDGFTEVIIPFIYSTYTIAMFQLPNRVFYPQIRQLDRNTLAQMIGNIAIYGLMELVSFVAMSVLLKRKLGISTLHQLAFVLDRERRMVQSNLFLWICYTIQNSLDHNGADFSWQFSWLQNKRS